LLRDLMFISQMGEPISKPFFVIGRNSLAPVCKDEQKSITVRVKFEFARKIQGFRW